MVPEHVNFSISYDANVLSFQQLDFSYDMTTEILSSPSNWRRDTRN